MTAESASTLSDHTLGDNESAAAPETQRELHAIGLRRIILRREIRWDPCAQNRRQDGRRNTWRSIDAHRSDGRIEPSWRVWCQSTHVGEHPWVGLRGKVEIGLNLEVEIDRRVGDFSPEYPPLE